jgi:hypothetical protein
MRFIAIPSVLIVAVTSKFFAACLTYWNFSDLARPSLVTRRCGGSLRRSGGILRHG